MRIPVSTQEPIRTSPDIPAEAYEAIRVSIPLVYNTISWLEIPTGYFWIVDAVQINFDTDANVGTRYVDLYMRQKDGQLLYYPAIYSAASFNNKHLAQPGLSYTRTSALEAYSTGPFWASVLPFPCRIGARWHTFQGAGDIGTLYAMVRQYKVK